MSKKTVLIITAVLVILTTLFFLIPGLFPNFGNPNTATLSDISGYVKVVHNGDDQQITATKGMRISQGDRIITGEASWAVLKFDDYKEATVFKNSTVSLGELGKADGSDVKRIVLEVTQGKVISNITKKLTEKEQYEVKTPTTSASCRGTLYYVEQQGPSTMISVFEGEVAASNGGSSDVKVEKNQQIVFDASATTVDSLKITEINTESFDARTLEYLKNNSGRVDGKVLQGIDNLIEEKKKVEFESAVSGTDEVSAVLDAVKAIKTNDKTLFMNAIKNINGAIPGLSELSYGEAKQRFIEAISYHTCVDLKSSLSLDETLQKITDAIVSGMEEEAAHYGIDISGLSLEEAQSKLEAYKQDLLQKDIHELNAQAAKFSIDITGLSREEAWAKVKQTIQANQQTGLEPDLNNPSDLAAMAQKLGVDISEMSTEEAINAVKKAMDEEKKAKEEWTLTEADIESFKLMAQKDGIDITGLSGEEIAQKVMEFRAAQFGLDITGLSPKQANQKINDAFFDQVKAEAVKYGVDITGLDLNEASAKVNIAREEATRIERQWNDLKQRAEFVGLEIDFTGMAYEDAKARVEAAEAYYNERKPLLEQAAQWGFDPTGMTNQELEDKIDSLLKSPHDFPKDDSGN